MCMTLKIFAFYISLRVYLFTHKLGLVYCHRIQMASNQRVLVVHMLRRLPLKEFTVKDFYQTIG